VTTLGIDIGGTAVKAALLGPDGASRTSVSAAYTRPDRQQLRSALRQAVGEVSLEGVRSVGLCVPGRRAPSGGCVRLSVNVPGLEGYPFDQIVTDSVGRSLPVRVCSDAEAATIDAARDHPNARRVLGIALGTGVGASLVEQGRPLRLGQGTIGHLGQVDIGLLPGIEPPGPIGPDGGRNSLEAYFGVAALRDRFGPEFSEVLPRLPMSDPALLALVRAVRIALAVYTPDLVLLLGGLGLALKAQREQIDAAIRRDLTRIAPSGWTLEFGRSRFHAAMGAARLAVEFSDIVEG
jgi:predicted NBD/HSP70 family sugar kinase